MKGNCIIDAWNEWAKTPEAKKAMAAVTLGQKTEANLYLCNRLQTAFIAGMEAGVAWATKNMHQIIDEKVGGRGDAHKH